MRHVREQLALAVEILDQPRALQRRPDQRCERVQEPEVPLGEKGSHPARVDVEHAQLPPSAADGRAQDRAQPEVEDALAVAQLLAGDDVRHCHHLAGAQHAIGHRARNAQRGAGVGAAHRDGPRLNLALGEEDEAALRAGEQQRFVESLLEQRGVVALRRQPLRRLSERLDVGEGLALQRLDVLLQPLHLAQLGGRSQLLEDAAGAAQERARLDRLAPVEFDQAGDAIDAGQRQRGAGAFQALSRRLHRRGRRRSVGLGPRGQREHAVEVPLLHQVSRFDRQPQCLGGAQPARARIALQQIQARADALGDGPRLPVECRSRGRVCFSRRDVAQVAAHHRLDARVPAGALDAGERAPEHLPGARRVAALAVEEAEVVEREQLLLQRAALLFTELLPSLERAVPFAGQVARHAQIVPGDGLLPLVAQDAVEVERSLRLAGRAVVARQQPVGGSEARERIRLGAEIALAPRDQHRGALLDGRQVSLAAMPGAGAEQVMEARGGIGVAALPGQRQRTCSQVLRPRVVPPHRFGARFYGGDGQRIGAALPRLHQRREHQVEAALLPAGLGDLLPDASGVTAAVPRSAVFEAGRRGLSGQGQAVSGPLAEQGGAPAEERLPQPCSRQLVEERRGERGARAKPLSRRRQRRPHPPSRSGAKQIVRPGRGISRQVRRVQVSLAPLGG